MADDETKKLLKELDAAGETDSGAVKPEDKKAKKKREKPKSRNRRKRKKKRQRKPRKHKKRQTNRRKKRSRKGQYAAIAEKTGDPDRGTGDFHFRADPAWKQRGGIFRV